MSSDEMDPESQLSPRFLDYLREKTTMDADVHEIPQASNASTPDHTFDYRQSAFDGFPMTVDTAGASEENRGIKVAHIISPIDGKTEGCDRHHTFDAFVSQQQIRSELESEKRVGHGWQVFRALKKVVGSSKKSRRKSQHVGVHAQQLAA
jgi:hypothetical protein